MRRRLARWLPRLIVLAALVTSMVTEAPARLGFTPCIFRNLTGLPCAGCGMTRGFVAMGHGRAREAWGFNPLAPVLFVGAWGYLLFPVVGWVWPAVRTYHSSRRARAAFYAVALLLIAISWSISLARHAAAPRDTHTRLVAPWLRDRLPPSAE